MTKKAKVPNSTMPPTASKPLVGKGRQGDFVHHSQTMSDKAGFRNVSQKWLDRCLPYDAVFQKLEEGKEKIRDLRIPFKSVSPAINQDGKFVMMYEGEELLPTRFALRHIAKQAGVSVFDVELLAGFRPDSNGNMRNRPRDRGTLMHLIKSGFSLIKPDTKFLFRTQLDGTLRAWLSDKYKIMDNLLFMGVIRDIIPNGLLSHWKDDGDFSTLWGNVLIPDSIRQETDSEYGGMFSIGNSEIGRRRLHATPSLFRAICMNGCIWDQMKGSTLARIHRGEINETVLMTLRNELRNHLNAAIPLVGNYIDQLLGTRAIGWDGGSMKPLFAALGERFTLSKTANTAILEAWRDECNEEPSFAADEKLRKSAFAVINAVTRSGNTETVKPETWVEREEMGGKLLAYKKDDWQSVFSRARSMKPEDVAGSFVMSNN